MQMYTRLMTAYGASAGIDFKFGGTVANTLDAHRVIQHFQETAGAAAANRIVDSLYRQYFEEEKHPSQPATLLAACAEAGDPEADARAVVAEESEGLQEVRALIREQAGNGVDSVPFIVFEGRRRDVTVQGAKEVEDYIRALETIVKESG
jgi:predicted DsbA family dithiol-disulfide isomerase